LLFTRQQGSSCELLALYNYLVVIKCFGSNLSRKFNIFCEKQVYFTQNFLAMTTEAIQQQIEAIKKANAEARQSPESAKKFLVEAGIVKSETVGVKNMDSAANIKNK